MSRSPREARLSRALLCFEDQVFVVTVATPAANEGAEVAVDGLDDAEGDLPVAVVQDAFEMTGEQATELLKGGQPLPAQGVEPK